MKRDPALRKARRRLGHTSPFYFIAEGIRSLFRHGFMSFAAVIIVLACLLIVGCFFMVVMNVSSIVTQLEQENEVIAYVDETYSESQAMSLSSEINKIENISSCTFTTRQEALEDFISGTDEPELFAGTDASSLRDRYYIVLSDITVMEDTIKSLESIEGIADVSAYLQLARGFATVRNVLRVVAYVITAVLLVISAFIISNTVKLATFARREEIGIMKTVGATNSFIRWPFLIQGLILGLLAAVAAFFLQWLIYKFAAEAVKTMEILELVKLLPFRSCAYLLALGDLAVGVLVGTFGSVSAIGKYLKK